MRSRFLIPAAILVAAACIERRREVLARPRAVEHPPAPAPAQAPDTLATALACEPAPALEPVSAPEPPSAPEPVEPAEVVSAPVAYAEDLAPEPPPAPEPVEPAEPSEVVSAPVADAEDLVPEPPPAFEPVVAEWGRFAVGGDALAAGHAAVSAVSFARRQPGPVSADAVRLRIESALNVPVGGLLVLGDPGFAPDAEGFTLMLAAEAAGRFAATGTYELLDQDNGHATHFASTRGIA